MSEAANHPNGVNGAYKPQPLALPPSTPSATEVPTTTWLLEQLLVPFGPELVKWRVHETRKVYGRLQGLVLPYADPRAYKDRLNALLTPAGWSDQFAIIPIPTKILVTCTLTIPSLGCHSATGEEWARDENAVTAAEAQAFKRACTGFGLGRYLYYFEGKWFDIDREKRPKSIAPLPDWATPAGWKSGLRPPVVTGDEAVAAEADGAEPAVQSSRSCATLVDHNGKNAIREIQEMEEELGKTLYRGILKSIARVWKPEEIREIALQKSVLRHMAAAQRGLIRAAQAIAKLNRPTVLQIFQTLDVDRIEKVSDLETLHKIVVALERAAETE